VSDLRAIEPPPGMTIPRAVALRRVDLTLALVTASLVLLYLWASAERSRLVLSVNVPLDLAITFAAVAGALAVAALSVPRYRADGGLHRLALIAFLLLVASAWGAQAVSAALGIGRPDEELARTPNQAALWVGLFVRYVAGLIIVGGGIAAVRRLRGDVPAPAALVLLPVAILLLVDTLLRTITSQGPPYLDPAVVTALEQLGEVDRLAAIRGGIYRVAPQVLLIAAVPALLAGIGAALYRSAHRVEVTELTGYTAVALVYGLFSELFSLTLPAVYSGVLTWADLLRLLMVVTLFLGALGEQRADLARLRRSVAVGQRLRASEAERAALEERRRIARDLHAGLDRHLVEAQAGLKRLLPEVAPEGRPEALEAAAAIAAARDGSSRALVLVDEQGPTSAGLAGSLAWIGTSVGAPVGLNVRFDLNEAALAAVDPEAAMEVEAIVREAAWNVVRHAGATELVIAAEHRGPEVTVSVTDDGRGFDPEAIPPGLGRTGMAERARLIGGRIVLRSLPEGGTVVELVLPATG